jgi:poly(3-hydroxybutyrate) depolymerase
MNKLYALIFGLGLISQVSEAQFDCSGGRYYQDVFPTFTLTSDVTYGEAINVNGNLQSLELDIYQPEGDTLSQRPLLILAHGGSFVFGSKTGLDVVSLCSKFVKLGYVVVSIEYRLGFGGLPSVSSATQAVYRGTSDMKAAIRFFRKSAGEGNPYKINPDYIFTGGVSAGAFTALHAAYIDEESEIPAEIDPVAFGGVEGNSGNPGFSSNTRAVVNLCGAIGDTSWINVGDVPNISMHGTNDPTVPYATDLITVLGFDLLTVDGSASIAQRMNNLGIPHEFISWQGADHVPFVSDANYQDSVYQFVVPFLGDLLGCDPTSTSAVEQTAKFELFPNPAKDVLYFQCNELLSEILLIDIAGRTMKQEKSPTAKSGSVDLSDMPAGIYLFQTITLSGERIVRKVIVE